MTAVTISGLFIYPVKSLAGIPLEESAVDDFGLAFDRRWMLVDSDGRFLSQRRLPRMALIRQSITGDALILQAEEVADLSLPLYPPPGDPLRVQVWDDLCEAWYCGNEAERWFSEYLGCSARLVYLPESHFRGVDQNYAKAEDRTAFSDGFPLLLISEASLADLNARLASPLSMSRFRPNLVVTGCGPFAEDGWSRLKAGELGLRVVKPCSRCIITTIDPATAERGEEPLKTLAAYRKQGNKVMFGQNLIHDGVGRLAVGMPMAVLT